MARRASEDGFKLLPETFVVLIYAFVNLDGEEGGGEPDVETASSLVDSMKVCVCVGSA